MSTAAEIIQDAYDSIGRGSEFQTTDDSLTNKGLRYLRSRLEYLRKNDIILEETENDVTTTVALPTLLTDELNEPVAATVDLTNYLAAYIAAQSRVNPADITIPSAQFSFDNMAILYRKHEIPSIIPSRLLPMGQGSRRYRLGNTFFNGQAVDKDAD